MTQPQELNDKQSIRARSIFDMAAEVIAVVGLSTQRHEEERKKEGRIGNMVTCRTSVNTRRLHSIGNT